ncbi:MAG: hypothetical protein ACW964_15590, partial [Candidatus Hodarchaeales archaeon]
MFNPRLKKKNRILIQLFFSILVINLFFVQVESVVYRRDLNLNFVPEVISIEKLKMDFVQADDDMGTGGDAYDSYSATDSATTLTIPISGTGYIDYFNDEYDCYKVAVNEDDNITVVFTPPIGSTGMDLPIYDTDYSGITTISNIVTEHTETVTASGDGYIYFTIDADNSNDVGTYYLSVFGEFPTEEPILDIKGGKYQGINTVNYTLEWVTNLPEGIAIDSFNITVDNIFQANVSRNTRMYPLINLTEGEHNITLIMELNTTELYNDSILLYVD